MDSRDGSGFDLFLQNAASLAHTDPVRLTIRELLRHAGQKRRGFRVVRRTEEALAALDLRSEPPFTQGWIDTEIELLPTPRREPQADTPPVQIRAPIGLKVAALPSTTRQVASVSPTDDIDKALSLMERFDYSQLAVMTGRYTLKGAVTWQSIAQARLRVPDRGLRGAMISNPLLVAHDEDLIPLIPRILERAFAFVRGRDNAITGVITPFDLSVRFAELAEPFVVLEEIERRLRFALERTFSIEELRALAHEGDAPAVEDADDLSLGSVVRCLQPADSFDRLGWRVDRVVFLEALDQVRTLRNDLVHFSPDPLDSDELKALQNFAKWLRALDTE